MRGAGSTPLFISGATPDVGMRKAVFNPRTRAREQVARFYSNNMTQNSHKNSSQDQSAGQGAPAAAQFSIAR